MDKHQAIWDAKYEKLHRGKRVLPGDAWLEDWLHLAPRDGTRRALDVGCGAGNNTRALLENGFEVTAIDFSERALVLCRRECPGARVEWADLRQGLPYPGEHFQLIVADQSLHYFSWDLTTAIFRDVVSRLAPGGLFTGRFNSTRGPNYRPETDEPVFDETNFLIVGGIEKRFFTRECFSKLFGPPWAMASIEEKTVRRFGSRKTLWEVAASRRDESPAEHDVPGDG